MEQPVSNNAKPDYGIDAPKAVRNLLIAGTVALILAIVAFSGVLPSAELEHMLRRMGTSMTLSFYGMGAWMIYSSKVSKFSEREWLLDLIPWRGDETVLDVGCGRGLMMIGAAKRLTTGTSVGIDIWQAEDLSGNQPEAPLENARLEGVADRVSVQTADMRQMPFPDGHFDAIVTNGVIHNLYKASERADAIREMARVLKPGGAVILSDVSHEKEYTKLLRANGVTEIQRRDTSITSPIFAIITFNRVRFFVIVGRKPIVS